MPVPGLGSGDQNQRRHCQDIFSLWCLSAFCSFALSSLIASLCAAPAPSEGPFRPSDRRETSPRLRRTGAEIQRVWFPALTVWPTQSRPEYAGHRRPRRFLAALRAGHEQSRPFSSGLLHPQQVRPSGQPAACADAQGSVPRLHHVETLVAEFPRDPVRGEAVAQTFKEADMRIMPENVNLDAPTSVFVLRPARET